MALNIDIFKIIDDVNYLISVYSTSTGEEGGFECSILHPSSGNVAFAAGRDGWAFTLTQFASLYNRMRKQQSKSLVNKLWGENYFDTESSKWSTSNESSDGEKKLKRGFEQYVLEPIYKVLNWCVSNQVDELEKFADKLDINFKLKPDEKGLVQGKDLMSRFMKRWLPAADAMLELVILHLPSPLTAQRYRVSNLYEGPLDDPVAIAIRECDPNAHLMVYVSKMLSDPFDKSKFFAFGRVFSGTAQPGMTVRIMTPDYKPDGSDTG